MRASLPDHESGEEEGDRRTDYRPGPQSESHVAEVPNARGSGRRLRQAPSRHRRHRRRQQEYGPIDLAYVARGQPCLSIAFRAKNSRATPT